MTTNGLADGKQDPQSSIRLYTNRASYHLPAALDIFRQSPIAHVAFIHPGDGECDGDVKGKRREETIMNNPLILVSMMDGDDEGDEASYSVYLHTHRHSGLVEAVERGTRTLTATTTKVDGLILSPTAHDHSLNYRSATLHLHLPTILDSSVPEQHEEKRRSLAEVTNAVTGYDRTTYVGNPVDPNLTNTTVVRCKIRSVSCKQRYGGFDSCKEPELRDEDAEAQGERAFQGVVPCWTEWGKPLGFGKDKATVEKHFDDWKQENRTFAERSAWGSEDVKLEGTGKKRK